MTLSKAIDMIVWYTLTHTH